MPITNINLEEELSKFPIKELNQPGEKDKIIGSLLQGEMKALTLEKTITPSNEISRYVIVEHLVPDPIKNGNVHIHNEMSEHLLLSDAKLKFHERVYQGEDVSVHTGAIRELLLVGRFDNKQLAYDKNGELDRTTGITLDYALTLHGKSYSLDSVRDLSNPVTVREKKYARFDFNSKEIQWYDAELNKKALESFWHDAKSQLQKNKVAVSSDAMESDLISKNKVGNKNGLTK